MKYSVVGSFFLSLGLWEILFMAKTFKSSDKFRVCKILDCAGDRNYIKIWIFRTVSCLEGVYKSRVLRTYMNFFLSSKKICLKIEEPTLHIVTTLVSGWNAQV
eukprot:TRINITY_DN13811_c0_g1_i1.p1 TRINITY_DN13811_c0_g1~~TRINITY_DN13811_c0_g1_i1.p1  ORF type:complete len:103 (+),score=0.18 TRINITY_DN13811_c0_g1_i1:134-442(+)